MVAVSMKKQSLGFTLLEILLAITIMTAVVLMLLNYVQQKAAELRRDKAAVQIQLIMNAAQAYYNNVGSWPVTCGATGDLTTLQTAGYLGSGIANNPWGNPYTVTCDTTTNATFSVMTTVAGATTSATEAAVLAGRLPVASVTGSTVTAMILLPPRVINNARSVNFGSVYHSGSCVPVPTCLPGMSAQIFVAPTGVSGVTDAPPSTNIYPMSSYSAFSTASATSTAVSNCSGAGTSPCTTDNVTPVTAGNYWRVCLSVMTSNGQVSPNTVAWGLTEGTVLAITRCVPTAENSGSDFTVWSQ
jgi:type II secretory pathway pseudopilin PulG